MTLRRTPSPEIEDALVSPEFSTKQHEIYHRLRENAPVYWSPGLERWLITSFDLVDEVLTDPELFTSVGAEMNHIRKLSADTQSDASVVREHFATPQLNITDPPNHTRIRRAFGRPFVPREIARFEESIRNRAHSLLDEAIGRDGRIDIVSDLAEPLPVQVISDIIGVPESHRDRIPVITQDQRQFFGSSSPGTRRASEFSAHLTEWHVLLSGWIADARHSPQDDIITRSAEMIDAGRITLDEAIATCLHLIIAGNGTTTALIGTSSYLLMTHPDQLALATENTDLFANAVEESLRFEAPLPRDRRIATTATKLGGQQISAGDHVVSVLAAANRDPDKFKEPDRFDITRSFTGSQHAAFGRGIHFCLGAPVARLEATVALMDLFGRFPAARPLPDFEPEWHPIDTHRGLVELPVHGLSANTTA